MTLCPYGSQPQTGAPVYKWATWVDAHSWLGAVFDILSPLIFAIQPVLYETAVLCATEPPQPVYPGDAVVAAAWTDRAAWEQCWQYLQDSATWWVWSHTCECLPAPGATTCVSIPGNAYGWTGQLSNGATYVRGTGFIPQQSGLSLTGVRYWATQPESTPFGVGVHVKGVNSYLGSFSKGPISSGYQEWLFGSPIALTQGVEYVIDRCFYAGVPWYYASGAIPNDTLVNYTTGFGDPNCSAIASSASNRIAILPLICGPSPATTPASPAVPSTSIPALPAEACTTTADLCAQIARVLVAEQLTQRRVDLLQRRTLPFAWIAGSALTGLTGAGAITVQDCLGAIVDLTTVPGSWGSSTDNPRRLYPAAGIVQGQIGSTWDDGRWVHYEHEVMLWQDSWATGLRYNFKPGVVATITPLYPEP